MQMNKEIEQHLLQIIKEDNKKNALRLDQSFLIQQHDSDLYRQRRALRETDQKLQLGSHCLGSGQAGIQEALIRNDRTVDPPISFGKYPNQQKVFLDEQLRHEGSEFDMELELDPLSMLHLSNASGILDKKSHFNEASIDQAINDLNQLDVIDMLLEEQYGGAATDMALDGIPNVDVRNGRNQVQRSSRDDDSLGTNTMAPVNNGAVVGNQRCAPQSVPKWIVRESLSGYDIGSDIGKDAVFLNPNQFDSFKKKKHRPDPIVIPPCVNNFQTVMSPHYSPNTAGCARKTPLLRAHPPPPYTALPVNGPTKGDRGIYQMPFDVQTPQSMPAFHFAEDRLMCSDDSSRMMRRETPMFSWDQHSVNSLIETEIHQFPESSCYSLITGGVNVASRAVRRLSLRSNSSHDELGRFGVNGGTETGNQDHGIWKTEELNGYR